MVATDLPYNTVLLAAVILLACDPAFATLILIQLVGCFKACVCLVTRVKNPELFAFLNKFPIKVLSIYDPYDILIRRYTTTQLSVAHSHKYFPFQFLFLFADYGRLNEFFWAQQPCLA